MNKKPDKERKHTPDILAEFTLFEENGRSHPVSDGYRPAHAVRDDYLTTGTHHYPDQNSVALGQTVKAEITFITPEYYPKSLWVGQRISVREGARVIGIAVVQEIYNEMLKSKNAPQNPF